MGRVASAETAPPKASGASLVLASGSPRRRWILAEMGVEFRIVPPGVEELEESAGMALSHIPLENAARKARAVAETAENELVLGADTVVAIDGELLGKPRDMEEAVEMLSRLSGRRHEVITGVHLVRLADKLETAFAEVSVVEFKRFDRRFAAEYAARVNALDKAGAYAVQDGGDEIVERVEGSIFNVMGLPAERLAETLEAIRLSSRDMG